MTDQNHVSVPIPPSLAQEDVDAMNDAERLGLLVAHVYGNAQAERDQARAIAVTLEGQLVQANEFLAKVVPILNDSTWATDSALSSSIQAFLDSQEVDSEQTPTQET